MLVFFSFARIIFSFDIDKELSSVSSFFHHLAKKNKARLHYFSWASKETKKIILKCCGKKKRKKSKKSVNDFVFHIQVNLRVRRTERKAKTKTAKRLSEYGQVLAHLFLGHDTVQNLEVNKSTEKYCRNWSFFLFLDLLTHLRRIIFDYFVHSPEWNLFLGLPVGKDTKTVENDRVCRRIARNNSTFHPKKKREMWHLRFILIFTSLARHEKSKHNETIKSINQLFSLFSRVFKKKLLSFSLFWHFFRGRVFIQNAKRQRKKYFCELMLAGLG